MSKTVSTRIKEEEAQKLDQIAKNERIDRSALIRKFIVQMLEQYEIKQKAELYQKGVVSLQEAATQANVSLYKMMEYIQKENIHPPDQTKEEIITEIEKSKVFF